MEIITGRDGLVTPRDRQEVPHGIRRASSYSEHLFFLLLSNSVIIY